MMIIIWLIIWLPILIWCIIGTYSDLKKHLIETTWTVSHIWVYHRSENSDIIKYSISATYDCWSKKWIEWDSIGSTGHYYEIGDKITLYCDENEPQRFYFDKDLYNRLLLWLIFWMPWIIMSLIWIIRLKRQNKQKEINHELKQFGTKVEATIIAINQCKIKIKNLFGRKFVIAKGIERFDEKLWFRIIAKHWENIFESENIYADIYYALDIWDKIDVYIDNNDYSKYFIDIDSILEKDYKIQKITTNKKWKKLLGWWIFVFIFSIISIDYEYNNCQFKYTSNFSLNNPLFSYFTTLFVGIFLIWLWTIRVIRQRKKKEINQELKQFGTKIEATILLVLRIPYKKSYNYRIVAKYNKETFISDEYPKNFIQTLRELKIKKWDKIDIYIDDSDYSKYFVDVDSLVGKYNNSIIID